MYAYVNNGEVMTTRRKLPSVWDDISGFNNLDDSEIIAYGWYPLEYSVLPDLQLDQYYGSEEFTIEADRVVSSRPVITRTVDEVKVWMRNIGRRVAENELQKEYSLLYLVLGLTGQLGAGYQTGVEEAVSDWIGIFQTFVGEVDACNTKAELLQVWNSYPQLHEVFD